jgi:hypothetical protein
MEVMKMFADALKVKKTNAGWTILFDPDERYQGARVEQKYLYKYETLTMLGIEYEDDPYAPVNNYGVTNAEIVWERATPDKILNKGRIVD